jgi:hypothetical protein
MALSSMVYEAPYISHDRRTHAEEIKMKWALATPLEQELFLEVKGRDSVAGLPKHAITSRKFVERRNGEILLILSSFGKPFRAYGALSTRNYVRPSDSWHCFSRAGSGSG